MRSYSPGGALNALASALKGSNPPTPSAHRLQRGLPGYLILFAPHTFASQRQYTDQEAAFATGVLPDIYAFHRYTRNSTSLSRTQEQQFRRQFLRLSRKISPPTYRPAYTPFTPNKSGQRLLPPYYRGCWHGVSRCFLWRYRHSRQAGHSSLLTELYDPQHFIPHAALLRQTFAHCAIFLTAASRRSLGRVSVPVWLIILSDQLPIVALVGRYPTNKLIGRRPILER